MNKICAAAFLDELEKIANAIQEALEVGMDFDRRAAKHFRAIPIKAAPKRAKGIPQAVASGAVDVPLSEAYIKSKVAKVVTPGSDTAKKIGGKAPISEADRAEFRKREAASSPGPGNGCSLGRDENGYYCYTHRARSKSYPRPAQIPIGRIRFIGSTA